MKISKLQILPLSVILLVLTGMVSSRVEAQIYFDIENKGVNGIIIYASGSAIVPAKSQQYFNIGVLDFGCTLYADESFQDFCENGHQTTINGGPWSFGSQGTGGVGPDPGISFNGILLNSFGSGPTGFGLSISGESNIIPDTDGTTPIVASGSLTLPGVDFSLLPGAPDFGQTTIISLFNEGNIIFRLNGGGASCNGFSGSDMMVDTDRSIEVCDQLSLGPDVTIKSGATATLSAGNQVDLLGAFMVEQGATLNVNVCGQSLCGTSSVPMPDNCHSCVTAICAADPWCCNNNWDSQCLSEVRTICDLVCD